MVIKQVIILRKDLKMRKGKMVAQGAHASMKVFFDKFQKGADHLPGIIEDGDMYSLVLDEIEQAWVDGLFTKICVGIEGEQELLDLYKAAKDLGLNASLIKDAGLTEFNEPTYTAVAIGPNKAEDIDPLTGNLKLL